MMKAKIMIVLCSIVLIFNMVVLIQNNFDWKDHFANYAGVLSMALLIVYHTINIKQLQKK
jgi:amino acid permease